jgi:hypothetical protein
VVENLPFDKVQVRVALCVVLLLCPWYAALWLCLLL